jgi:hypothetical protein
MSVNHEDKVPVEAVEALGLYPPDDLASVVAAAARRENLSQRERENNGREKFHSFPP